MVHNQKELVKQANKLLSKKGYLYNGSPRQTLSTGQLNFEKRIIKTPMGNGSR